MAGPDIARRLSIVTDLRQTARDLLEAEPMDTAAAAITTADLAKLAESLQALVDLVDDVPDPDDMESMYPRDREDGEGIHRPSYGE